MTQGCSEPQLVRHCRPGSSTPSKRGGVVGCAGCRILRRAPSRRISSTTAAFNSGFCLEDFCHACGSRGESRILSPSACEDDCLPQFVDSCRPLLWPGPGLLRHTAPCPPHGMPDWIFLSHPIHNQFHDESRDFRIWWGTAMVGHGQTVELSPDCWTVG